MRSWSRSPARARRRSSRLSGEGYRVQSLGFGVVGATGAGITSALLGIGGGIIKVPLMHLAMGVPLRVATATSNMMIGITAAASAVIYIIHGGIDPYVAGPTAIGVFIGATAGSRLGHRVDIADPAAPVRRRAGLHGDPDAAPGRSHDAARRGPRPRASEDRAVAAERRIGRLLIAMTYVAVGLLVVGVVLMVADGISPLSGGPASTSRHWAASSSRSTRRRSCGSGCWLVVATPIGRVIVAGIAYAREADWLMVAVAVGDPRDHRHRRRERPHCYRLKAWTSSS